MNENFIYKCPKCGRDIVYKTKEGFEKAIKEIKVCRICRDLIRGENGEYVRDCPECGTKIFYKRQSDFVKAKKKNTLCLKCAAKHSTSTFKPGQKQHENNISAKPIYSLDSLLTDSLESYY